MPGLAHAVGSFADKLEEQGLVGSIAGNDTILLIIRRSAPKSASAGLFSSVLPPCAGAQNNRQAGKVFLVYTLPACIQELLLGEKGMGEKRAAGTAGQ